jgi:hypothetical protein
VVRRAGPPGRRRACDLYGRATCRINRGFILLILQKSVKGHLSKGLTIVDIDDSCFDKVSRFLIIIKLLFRLVWGCYKLIFV